MTIPLKLKYRNKDSKLIHRSGIDPVEGTLIWAAEAHSYKGRTGNSNGIPKKRSSVRPRKRAYGPF